MTRATSPLSPTVQPRTRSQVGRQPELRRFPGPGFCFLLALKAPVPADPASERNAATARRPCRAARGGGTPTTQGTPGVSALECTTSAVLHVRIAARRSELASRLDGAPARIASERAEDPWHRSSPSSGQPGTNSCRSSRDVRSTRPGHGGRSHRGLDPSDALCTTAGRSGGAPLARRQIPEGLPTSLKEDGNWRPLGQRF